MLAQHVVTDYPNPLAVLIVSLEGLALTSESNKIQERRVLHVVGAGLAVSKGKQGKQVELERRMFTYFSQCSEGDDECTIPMKITMKKAIHLEEAQ